jgi:hypothetical protein
MTLASELIFFTISAWVTNLSSQSIGCWLDHATFALLQSKSLRPNFAAMAGSVKPDWLHGMNAVDSGMFQVGFQFGSTATTVLAVNTSSIVNNFFLYCIGGYFHGCPTEAAMAIFKIH